MGMNLQQPDPKLLVVGGGGREHALCWRLRQDRPHAEIYCAPGNTGAAEVARTLDIGAGDIDDLVLWARSERPDMVVVGPEDPLIDGLVDELQTIGVPAFGPTRRAAEIEGSKAFSSALVTHLGVPAPVHATFDDVDAALAYVEDEPDGVVVKADGPALGKGVIVCGTPEEADAAIRRMMVDGAFGASGSRVVVQELLRGPELSVLALSDGTTFRTIGVARDYKRIGDGDRGPNTGGVGSYTPVPDAPAALVARVEREIIAPVLARLRADGRPYVGVLFAGLILTAEGPKVIEFNCRMGDPETQVVLPVLQGDFVDLIDAAVSGTLDRTEIPPPEQAAVAVVVTSKGYPGPSESGLPIDGLDAVDRGLVFHAGTARRDGAVRTAGGRVLAAVGIADELDDARDEAYAIAASIRFEGAGYRSDIAADALGMAVAS